VKTTNSAASQVLRLVVGMLGMEVHEQPSSWAESWLTFQDQTFASLGIGTKKSIQRTDADLLGDTPAEWQLRVLEHLRQHVEQRSALPIDDLASPHDWGPDFQEHLDLAEFALLRISHAVNVLQDPEKHDRPLLLREYTEEMVMKVCKDLRQWLDQLATLLSLYHVHLLDLEAERRKVAHVLGEQQAQLEAGEEARKAALRKHDVLHKSWEEEKMKRDAERLLGLSCDDDAKIYSQRDMDEFYRKWEQEHLEPLMIEIRDMRISQEKLRDRNGKSQSGIDSSDGLYLSKASLGLLISIVGAVNERTYDKALNKCLTALGEDIQSDGSNLSDILSKINAIAVMDEAQLRERFGSGGEGDIGVAKCLSSLLLEFENLENELQQCPINSGADKLRHLASWTKDTIEGVNSGIQKGNMESVRWQAPPKWDLGILNKNKMGGIRTTSVNTTDDLLEGYNGVDLKKQLEVETANRVRKFREEMEAKIRDAMERAERERLNAQDALERLGEETEKADVTLAELRRKIQMLEALLREKGLGKQAADAMWGSGLTEFMQGRDVFERLYRDALDRMRRNAEAQARWFEECSLDFLRTVGMIMDPQLQLPGLDVRNLHDRDLSSLRYCGDRRSSRGSRSPGSRSPSGSPNRASRSPRQVVTAPSRIGQKMDDLLNVGRLGPPLVSRQRMESAGFRQSQSHINPHGSMRSSSAASLQKRERPDTVLQMIGSSPTPLQEMRRPASQNFASQLPSRSRQSLARSTGAESKMLPPLECKGQGQLGVRSRSPSNDALEERMRRIIHAGPSHEARSMDREKDVFSSHSKDPLMTIGSLRTGGTAPPSGLLPPHMLQEPRSSSAAKLAIGRPGTHGTNRTQSRQGGAMSMPHLGPPRLLVQSVGAAY